MKVIKRDGRSVNFDKTKIENAINRAFIDVYPNESIIKKFTLSKKIADEIEAINEDLSVEEIQDIVEKKLMASKEKEVAKSYIIYRENRRKIREMNSDIVKMALKKINGEDVQNSNANVDENSFSGRNKESSSALQKYIALEYNQAYSEDVTNAHKTMTIYQHDLDEANSGEHNCLNVNMPYILGHGFRTKNGDVRPAGSFSTACQLVAVAFQCQSQVQFGGVGSIHLDYDLAPYVKKSFRKYFLDACLKRDAEKLISITQSCIAVRCDFNTIKKREQSEIEKVIEASYGEICLSNEKLKQNMAEEYTEAYFDLLEEGNQAAQGLFHNLNTLESRQGSQVPFTSINFGRDTSIEGRLVSTWLLNASLNGIGKHHRTSIFPISIFQYKKGTNANKGDINYDLKKLAINSMSHRIYPNWVNGDWSQAHEDENNIDTFFSTMGCRTMIGYDRHGLGYSRQGRGNNVPNTIILPKLGIEYGICLGERETPDLEGFWNAFEEKLRLCEKGLLERYNVMKRQSPKSAPFMYKNNTIAKGKECKENVEESLKHNTLAIGYIGIAEMCTALFGVNHVHNKDVHSFALSVVKRIHDFAQEASERNDLNFSCYATPAENLCYTAMTALKKQYGEIPGVTERSYFTNSHHVPVWEKVSIYEKLEIEAPFCKYPTGGCITYVELDSDFINNQEAIEDIIDYAFTKLDIPYLAFNFPIDTCLDCGYQGDFTERICTCCGSTNVEQLRRVTGYLTTDYHNFNRGKRDEVLDREKHSLLTKLADSPFEENDEICDYKLD